MTERTFAYLAGLLRVGDTAEWPAVDYARTATELLLVANGDVPSVAGGTIVKLTLDDVAELTQYTLPLGSKRATANVGGGDDLLIAADVRPGVIVTAHGGASNLVVWLTSEATVEENTDTGWVILTAGMLQSRIAAPEYDALTAAIIAAGQSDPVPILLNDVTERVRAAVRSGGRVALGPVNTIPASLRRAALSLAKYDLFARIAALRRLAEQAKDDADRAEKQLERIEEGKVTPEAPDEGNETETAPTGETGADDAIDL